MLFGTQNDGRSATALSFSRRWRIPLLLLALAAGDACFAATTGRILSGPPLPVRSLEHLGWAIADFDGDSQPDLAITKMEAQGAGYVYWLEFELSTKREAEPARQRPGLPVLASSVFGLHLTPRDVDGDHDLDIVITVGIARQPVAVWINDGQGGFAEGDLALYPALNCREDLSLSPQIGSESTPLLYDPGRRCQFGLLVSDQRHPLLNSHSRSLGLPRSSICLFLTHQRPARAPPSLV
jgi:hypothetical protein